jgi:hypothetical protein
MLYLKTVNRNENNMTNLTIGNGVPLLLPAGIDTIDDVVPNLVTTSVDEVTGNVAGPAFEPFARIEKQELYNADSFQSRAYNIKVEDTKGDMIEAGIVGAEYLLVPNAELHEIGEEIRNNTGSDWQHVKTFFNGKQYRNIYTIDNMEIEIPEVGEVAKLMMTEQNSYDKSLSAGLRFDFMIWFCKNGMSSKKHGWGYSFRHNQGNVNWADEVVRAGQILKNQSAGKLSSFAESCAKLSVPLDLPKLKQIRETAIPKLPDLRFGQIMTKYLKGENDRIWDFMQAGTATLWHKDKMTVGDFTNNEKFVDGLLEFAPKLGAVA